MNPARYKTCVILEHLQDMCNSWTHTRLVWDNLIQPDLLNRGLYFYIFYIQHQNYRMSHKSSLTGNTVFVAGWIKHNGWHILEIHCWEKGRNCPFACLWPWPTTDSSRISLLSSQQTMTWIEFCWSNLFKISGAVSTNHKQGGGGGGDFKLMTKEVNLYLPQSQGGHKD
jgi:hypothetical protein